MKLTTLLDVDVVAVEATDRLSLLLELTAPAGEPATARPARALQVVLDRSGSMAGEPLEAAKAALCSLVTRLDPADAFGLVAFDDDVQIVVPAAPLADKDAVKAAVAAIAPGGMTNLSAGYLRGVQEARRAGGAATLLLVSDGHANAGVVDPDRLEPVARAAHDHGVTTSTIGLGLGYDEVLLSAMARGGTGNHRFAADPDEGAAALAAEVDGLLAQVVQAATLTIRPTGDVASATLHNDLPMTVLGTEAIVELGDFYAGEQRKVVLSLDVPAMPALGLAQVAELELRWVDAAALTTQTVTLPVHVNVVPGDEAAGRLPNPVVRNEVAFQEAQQAKRRVAEALREDRAADAADAAFLAVDELDALAAAAPPAQAAELREEADYLRGVAARAASEAVLLSKELEADRHRKSRRRGG